MAVKTERERERVLLGCLLLVSLMLPGVIALCGEQLFKDSVLCMCEVKSESCMYFRVKSKWIANGFNLMHTVTLPRAGSGVVRMDPLRFLAGCRTRQLNQA